MIKFILLILCFIYTANSSEYMFAICNMCGEPVDLLFSAECNLQHSASCTDSATFVQLTTHETFKINHVEKFFFKLIGVQSQNTYYFSINNRPDIQIKLIPNWWDIKNIFGVGKYCVIRGENIKYTDDMDGIVRNIQRVFVIYKYTQNSDIPMGLSHDSGGLTFNLPRLQLKNLCNIQ